MQEEKMAQNNLILKFRTGSHLYGTANAESDEDFIGVCIPDMDYVIGTRKFEQWQCNTNSSFSGKCNTNKDIDITIYGLPKFVKLLTGNNPNIIEVLFAPENCILYCDDFGQKLLDSVKLFVSQKCYYTFSGYAHSQERKLMDKNPIGSRKEMEIGRAHV